MELLLIDTSTPYTVMAHCRHNKKWEIENIRLEKMEKEKDNWLETQLDDFTKNFPLEKFDVLACGSGPGSFTGLRIGFAYLKTMAILWNKIFYSYPTRKLMREIFLSPEKSLFIQLNASLYISTDNNEKEIDSLEYWLNLYERKKNVNDLYFWNFYNYKKPFPSHLNEIIPENFKFTNNISLDLPSPEYLDSKREKLIEELPDYGFEVELNKGK